MRSRVLRTTLAATLLVAAAAAAVFLVRSEQTLTAARIALREFDQRARQTADGLFDARAAQQAYVAAGQGLDYWVPQTAKLIADARGNLHALHSQARTAEAGSALQSAAAAVDDLSEIDSRARGYLQTDQTLMAGDVIFTEGGSTATAAGRHLEAARLAERDGFDAVEATSRRLEAGILASLGLYAVIVVSLLAVSGRAAPALDEPTTESVSPAIELSLRAPRTDAPRPDEGLAALRTAAELCSAFGQVTDLEGMKGLLNGVATSLGATGVIVWVGTADGADLRPALAHGYAPQALARMTPIPRTADNAAAAAYRTGRFQVVRAAHNAPGALVAPLLVPGGCLGALTAEVRAGNEAAESMHALAKLYAAQLAGILATPVPAEEPTVSKTATG